MKLRCDAVFEGGGVRGIGHVGAAYALEQAGYQFENLVGSSAGAIVAALLAAGYTAEEIKNEIETLDYLKFKQARMISRLGILGKLTSVYLHFGVYDADFFEEWMTTLLKRKGVLYFSDLKTPNVTQSKYCYKLQVTASDITDQRLLTLPQDFADFGIDPEKYSIAKAVRMSMSIPIFYKPFHLVDSSGKEHLIVDGGLLSNYPIRILDDGSSNPPFPTFGFKFVENMSCKSDKTKFSLNIVNYIKSLVGTMLDASDNQHISESKGDFQRTIAIGVTIVNDGKAKKIGSTKFDISREESCLLFENGVQAGKKFLEKWDFDKWKNMYRGKNTKVRYIQ